MDEGLVVNLCIMKNCPRCNEGFFSGIPGKLKCPRCNGNGYIHKHKGIFKDTERVECNECQGTRYITCSKCQGRGKV